MRMRVLVSGMSVIERCHLRLGKKAQKGGKEDRNEFAALFQQSPHALVPTLLSLSLRTPPCV